MTDADVDVAGRPKPPITWIVNVWAAFVTTMIGMSLVPAFVERTFFAPRFVHYGYDPVNDAFADVYERQLPPYITNFTDKLAITMMTIGVVAAVIGFVVLFCTSLAADDSNVSSKS